MTSWETSSADLAAQARRAGDPTNWFEPLYAAGARGEIEMPWSRDDPSPALRGWCEAGPDVGADRRALVVGCALGADAEYLAGCGYSTTAFDVSPTAVAVARERHPRSLVEYQVADLLALPSSWSRAFDLVVEILTVQALPPEVQRAALDGVISTVRPGGTLLMVENVAGEEECDGPPWPLTRGELEECERDGLTLVTLEKTGGEPERWYAEFRRPR